MASATVTTLDGVLKSYYDDFKVKVMQYGESTLLAVLPRMTKFGGKNLPIPIVYSTPSGRATTIAQAQAVAAAAKTTDFTLTRASDYGVVTISNEALEAADMGDKSAFVSARVTEIDGVFKQLVRSLSTSVFGTGSGTIGRCASNTSTSITLDDPEQIVNFDIGMVLNLSSADGSGARTGDTGAITAIDYDLGTITVDTSGVNSIGQTDYIYVKGDLNAKIAGLAGWIPVSAPSATAWFGVDRSVSPTKLGGVRVPTTVAPAGIAIEEKLVRACARVARQGGKPDLIVMNNLKFAELQSSLGTRVIYSDVKTEDEEFGFRSIQITSGTNTVDVLADPYCPSNVAYFIQKDTWKLYSLGEVPRFENSDGLMMLRQSTADGVEVRCKYYAQMGCTGPGFNGRVAI